MKNNINYVAWGCSKILEICYKQNNTKFKFIIDKNFKKKHYQNLKVFKNPNILKKQKNLMIVIFAVSNSGLRSISEELNGLGFHYGRDFMFYSDFYDQSFKLYLKKFNLKFDNEIMTLAKTLSLNSIKSIHSNLFGLYLYLYLIKKTKNQNGKIAEIGCYEGGSSLAAAQVFNSKKKTYYLIDTFEGFPQHSLSKKDKKNVKKGDYKVSKLFSDVALPLEIFENIKLIKMPVPSAFVKIKKDSKFSVVFFDCDLFKPAVDTLNFFWEKMCKNGFIMLHDYYYEKNGYEGVKIAVDSFLKKNKNCEVLKVPHAMSVIIKKK